MKRPTASASKTIHASAESVYRILADYRSLHPQILPKPYFLSLDVEEGGYGAGTIVNFKMRILGQTQSFRSRISEPEPGRSLLELDLNSGTATRFDVLPLDAGRVRVTISTGLKNRSLIESYLARPLLQRIYRRELQLLAPLAAGQAGQVASTAPNQAR